MTVPDATDKAIALLLTQRNALRESNAELVEALAKMLDVYWGDGDGDPREPSMIVEAKTAIANAKALT